MNDQTKIITSKFSGIIFRVLLSLLLVATMLPANAYALETAQPATSEASGSTDAPAFSGDAKAIKEHAVDTDLVYTLTNPDSYGSDTIFKVYSDPRLTSYASGITATLSGSQITINHLSNVPVGKLYITATNTGSAESASTQLSVAVETGKVVIWKQDPFAGDHSQYVGWGIKGLKRAYGDLGYTLTEEDGDLTQYTLDGASLLIITWRQHDVDEHELAHINAFIQSGGRIIAYGENTEDAGNANVVIQNLSQKIGGKLSDGGGEYLKPVTYINPDSDLTGGVSKPDFFANIAGSIVY